MNAIKVNLLRRNFFALFFLYALFHVGTLKAQNNEAIDSLSKAIKISIDDTAKVRTYNLLITKFFNTGRYKEGLETSRQSLLCSQILKFTKGIGDAYNNIGLMHENLGNKDSALTYYFTSLSFRDQNLHKKQISASYSNIGNVYSSKGLYSDAIKYHFMSLKLREELNDSASIAKTYNNIGLVYNRQSNYEEAILNYKKSLSISTLLKNQRDLAMVFNNLSVTKKNLGNYEEAIQYNKNAIELNTILSNNHWLGKNYSNLGNLYKLRAKLLKEEGNDSLALTYKKNAIDAYNTSLSFWSANENKEDYVEICNSIGEFKIDEGKLKEAEVFNKKSLQYLSKIDNNNLKKGYFDFSARLYSELALQMGIGDSLKVDYLKIAFDSQRESNKLKDSLFNENNSKQIAEIKTKFETEKKDHAIVILSNEKNIQQLVLKEKQAALLFSQLQLEKRKGELGVLQETKDLQELELSKTHHDLEVQLFATKVQKANLELEKADKTLKEQQLLKEKYFRYGMLIFIIMVVFISGLLFSRYNLQKKIENQKSLINERKRISNELHDDLGAQLSVAKMFLNSLEKNSANTNNYSLVQHSISIIDTSISDLRNIMEELQSNTLHQNGYVAATEELINTINALRQVNFSLTYAGLEIRIDLKIELQLFRITQELINNTLKYANAKFVSIDLVVRDEKIILLYEDDGLGFDLKSVKLGYGLANIESRVRSLNGVVEFDAMIGKGARTIIEIPLKYVS